MSATHSSKPKPDRGLSYRGYLAWTAWPLVLALGAVLTFNALIDPYRMQQDRTVQGWNHFKVGAFGKYDRMVKAEQINRARADAILLGSSRVAWALCPDHPALEARAERTVNAGLAGATIYELYRYLQHAQAAHPLRLAIVGLDIEQFNLPGDRTTFRENRLAVTAEGRANRFHRVEDLIDRLATLDALEASWESLCSSRTLKAVPEAELPLTGWRFRDNRTPEERVREYQGSLREAHRNFQPLRHQGPRIEARLAWYRALLVFAHEHRIELHLFVTPYHHSLLDVIDHYQGRAMFDGWKQALHDINLEEAEQAGAAPFPLVDFSPPSPITTEALPSPEHRDAPMTFYRESSHYRQVVGDRILERLLGSPVMSESFGVDRTRE